MRKILISIVALLLMATPTVAAPDRDVFVLSIGSGDYAETDNTDTFAFDDNDAAYLGALRVARLFRNGGARHVLQLLGRDGEYISAADIFTAIDDIAATIEGIGAENPILIVYFSGHGFSDSFGYNLFMAPGDLVIPHTALDLSKTITTVINLEGVGRRAPTGLSVKEQLDATGIPYFLIVDTCFETDAGLDLQALRRVDERAAKLSNDVSDILRFMNLPRGPHPVVFSAPPGTLALPERDPLDEGNYIAPMARRLVLAARQTEARGETLDLAALSKALTHDNPAIGRAAGVTWFEGDFEVGSILKFGTNSSASIDRRRGTSFAANMCCERNDSDPAPTGDTFTWAVSGQVAFRPDGEDFVTGGQPFDNRFTAQDATVWQVSPNSIEIDVDQEDRGRFSIAISVPQPAFTSGVFSDAQRHAFSEAGSPGLSVSIDGNGCNEVTGGFTVTRADFDTHGRLQHLDVNMRQVCDSDPGALTGSASLSFRPLDVTTDRD